MLNNKSILITGGTGSFGENFIKLILKKFKKINRLVIFSRDEYKQFKLQQKFDLKKYKNLRFFLGDIRDRERIKTALNGVEIVIHAAALKQVPAAEYNPFEFIKTNVIGSENLISACLETTSVKKVIALSTDKASAPINLYGATKLCSDKLFISANNIRGKKDITFSIVRYGNVLKSRGSIVPFFQKISKSSNIFPITDLRMTRFNISLNDACNFVLKCIKLSQGGEIYIPKISSFRIVDLAKSIKKSCRFKIIGIRPGEKIHEEMITVNDSLNTLESKDHYIIIPPEKKKIYLSKNKNYKPVKEDFSYNSFNNKEFLSIKKLNEIVNL
jgi:UDP-N-acetylglucosamine 4,6-dehydratase (inverting)